MNLAMIVAYEGPFQRLFVDTTLLVLVFSAMVDGMMSRYLANHLDIIRTDRSQSTVHNFLVLTTIFAGAELHNLLGMDMVSDRNNCFHDIERTIFRFLITDKNKLTDVYRRIAKGERRLFFNMLQKHSHKSDGQKGEHDGKVSRDAVKMEEITLLAL